MPETTSTSPEREQDQGFPDPPSTLSLNGRLHPEGSDQYNRVVRRKMRANAWEYATPADYGPWLAGKERQAACNERSGRGTLGTAVRDNDHNHAGTGNGDGDGTGGNGGFPGPGQR